ncbi:LOW QUALITY PROTEIN: ER_lumen_recept domain-containing protein, partial [Cephalotus follicularis]
LSLKSQELTTMFVVKLYCNFVIKNDIHTLIATLATTLWVIYMIRFNLKSSYTEDKDNYFAMYYVVNSSLFLTYVVLAFLFHPPISHHFLSRIRWTFCVSLEDVSVLPQLGLCRTQSIVETFTTHYVFAFRVARFLSCAH